MLHEWMPVSGQHADVIIIAHGHAADTVIGGASGCQDRGLSHGELPRSAVCVNPEARGS
jgi:hypothetical protein